MRGVDTLSFAEVLRKIRVEEKDSYRSLSKKTGITHSYFDKIERGVSPINAKILEALIQVYPHHKTELVEAYCKTTIPKFVFDTICDSKIIEKGSVDIFKNEIKVFSVISNTDGVLLPEYGLREMSTTVNINEKDFCIEILGNEMGNFCDGDVLLVETIEKPWQLLNQKVVIIEKKGERFIKRVTIKNFKPCFESLNGLYEPLEYNEDITLVGVVTKLLYRNLSEIKF